MNGRTDDLTLRVRLLRRCERGGDDKSARLSGIRTPQAGRLTAVVVCNGESFNRTRSAAFSITIPRLTKATHSLGRSPVRQRLTDLSAWCEPHTNPKRSHRDAQSCPSGAAPTSTKFSSWERVREGVQATRTLLIAIWIANVVSGAMVCEGKPPVSFATLSPKSANRETHVEVLRVDKLGARHDRLRRDDSHRDRVTRASLDWGRGSATTGSAPPHLPLTAQDTSPMTE